MSDRKWKTHNAHGKRRVIVTKDLPGDRWLEVLLRADCRVEVCISTDILGTQEIQEAIGHWCEGAIGQLTEVWGEELFANLKSAGGKVYSNYAVGYNNVDLGSATKYGISVGNTPGVLTETTAEMAVALTFAAARRVAEGERFMRGGRFKGWLPNLFLGELLRGKTVGVIGAGRIGAAYARMMVEGHKMNLIYCDPNENKALEEYIAAYGAFLKSQGEKPLSCHHAKSVEELLREADVVSLNPVLEETTYHMINKKRLSLMKENAILVNVSRGPIIDESALVEHCRNHPNFRVGLDVFENEPELTPGLTILDNVVLVPHIGSATIWTRSGMATLAACNVAGLLMGYPVWVNEDVFPFLADKPPKAAPSIVNARELNIPIYSEQIRIT